MSGAITGVSVRVDGPKGGKFFNEIIQHPVTLDMNTLTALKRCSLGLDLYLWLTYRTFALRAPQRLTASGVPSVWSGPGPRKGPLTIVNFLLFHRI